MGARCSIGRREGFLYDEGLEMEFLMPETGRGIENRCNILSGGEKIMMSGRLDFLGIQVRDETDDELLRV